jgi:hypothetical protein
MSETTIVCEQNGPYCVSGTFIVKDVKFRQTHGKPRTTERHVIVAPRVSGQAAPTTLDTTRCGLSGRPTLRSPRLAVSRLSHRTVGLRLDQVTRHNRSYEVSTTSIASPSWA